MPLHTECEGSHPRLYVEGTKPTDTDPSSVHADAAADAGATNPWAEGAAVFLNVRESGKSASIFLTDEEALQLAEQIICALRVARAERAVRQVTA